MDGRQKQASRRPAVDCTVTGVNPPSTARATFNVCSGSRIPCRPAPSLGVLGRRIARRRTPARDLDHVPLEIWMIVARFNVLNTVKRASSGRTSRRSPLANRRRDARAGISSIVASNSADMRAISAGEPWARSRSASSSACASESILVGAFECRLHPFNRRAAVLQPLDRRQRRVRAETLADVLHLLVRDAGHVQLLVNRHRRGFDGPARRHRGRG